MAESQPLITISAEIKERQGLNVDEILKIAHVYSRISVAAGPTCLPITLEFNGAGLVAFAEDLLARFGGGEVGE